MGDVSSPAAAATAAPAQDDDSKQDVDQGRVKRLNPIKAKQLEDRAAELEAESTELECEIAALETDLQGFVSAEETRRQMDLLAAKKSRLEVVLDEWERVSLQLEEAR